MFENLQDRLGSILNGLTGRGALSEKDVAQAMREGDPQIGGHGVLPPHSALEQEAVPEEKSRRGLFAAAAVLGLVVAGGAVFALFDFGGSDVVGPPPVITASDEPLKIYPEGEEPAASGQSKLIYDRVGGVETPREERLVVRDESPVASLPPAPVAEGDPQTRVPAGPRRVRTVVVRPDAVVARSDTSANAAASLRLRIVIDFVLKKAKNLHTVRRPRRRR